MQTTYQITGNDLAREPSGSTKPVKKVRDTSLQAEVMAEAHYRYRLYRERNAKTKRVNGRWMNAPAAYSAADFGICLAMAWSFIKAKRARDAWHRGETQRIAIDEATFQSCRSDSSFTSRRGI
ncbi:hypothetical protein DKP76_11635 [Falsochrobactrum shanghaiense]|uniref:Uncharacterized protein n=1 Tax=Falsochrobactrum shanghaiense TaxID=2201899 RepID=A0A316JE81_9HYPH|nr:hypothetical protein [Falsochrobactrum shanghaiense]PWL17423.1 hypothetical protein DKP76_11635 [Falsochrobactrum shanghaiense]